MRKRRTPGRHGFPDLARTADWAPVAYRLWRWKRLTFVEIQRYLDAEGWEVPIWAIADEVHRGVGRELAGRETGRKGRS